MAPKPRDDQTWLDSLTTQENKQSRCFRRFLEVSNMLSVQALLFVDVFEIYSQTWSYLEKNKTCRIFPGSSSHQVCFRCEKLPTMLSCGNEGTESQCSTGLPPDSLHRELEQVSKPREVSEREGLRILLSGSSTSFKEQFNCFSADCPLCGDIVFNI